MINAAYLKTERGALDPRAALGVLDRIAAGVRDRMQDNAEDAGGYRLLARALDTLATMKDGIRAGRHELDASGGGTALGALLAPVLPELEASGLTIRLGDAFARGGSQLRTPCPALRAGLPDGWRLIVQSWGTWGCREHLFGMLHGMRSGSAPQLGEACRGELQALIAEHDQAFPEHAPANDIWAGS